MNEEFDAANAQLVKEHAEAIESLKHRYDAAIAAEQVAAAGLEEDKRTLQGQFASLADDIELDVDAEMEGMRARFERKLQSEAKNTLLLQVRSFCPISAACPHESVAHRTFHRSIHGATLLFCPHSRLQGENGFWKHKFVKANKEMSEKKEELSGACGRRRDLVVDFTRPSTSCCSISSSTMCTFLLLCAAGLVEKEKELHEAIAALQKDVAGHKKEIRERDETVLDKVRADFATLQHLPGRLL